MEMGVEFGGSSKALLVQGKGKSENYIGIWASA